MIITGSRIEKRRVPSKKPLNIKRIEMVLISLFVSFAVLLSVVPCSVLAEDTSANEETLNNKTSSGQSEAEENYDIDVTVGMPSYANVYKDICVDLTYNDDFFGLPSSVYNNDLAYASACLAATSDNSNEEGADYSFKSKNIVSFMQQIGCKDITINDGYNYKPMQRANIGVAIGYKDILAGGKNYRLFVFGIRGGGYDYS